MAPKSVPVPMITRVRLKNFRSIAECDVTLGPLTILVGPNGSGKSNFLHALDFLSDALNNGLETAVRRRGGMNSLLSRWAVDNPDATLEIGVEMDLHEGRQGVYAVSLKRTQVNGSAKASGFELTSERCVVREARTAAPLTEFTTHGRNSEWWDVRGADHLPPFRPALGPRTLTLPHTADHLNFGLVYRALRGIACYSLHVSEMRKPHEPDGGERLAPDGSNVASVLDRMMEKNTYGVIPVERLLDWMRAVVPDTVAVRPLEAAGYLTLQIEQRAGNGQASWTFDASEMSYGTLRTLGVFVALFQGRTREVSSVTFAGIEEPESAVHPGAATALLEAMMEASLVTQVIATTHGASMLDYDDLDVDILRGVARENGRTTIGPVDAASRQILEEALSTAGELLRMRHLMPDEPSNGTVESPVAAPG